MMQMEMMNTRSLAIITRGKWERELLAPALILQVLFGSLMAMIVINIL